jgi:hypothetical protein
MDGGKFYFTEMAQDRAEGQVFGSAVTFCSSYCMYA